MSNPANPFHAQDPVVRTLAIFGAGGFGREVAWLARQCWVTNVQLLFAVDRPEFLRGPVNGIPVRLLADIEPSPNTRYVVAIGDPAPRRAIVEACTNAGLIAGRLVHPRVEASEWVGIGPGAIVCAGSILTTNIQLGAHVHVNLDCTIGHDAAIGEFTTLAPGVHVSGNVRIGSDVFVGTGATIINGSPERPLVIGDGAVIAAGACVTGDVAPGAMMAGVPAIKKR